MLITEKPTPANTVPVVTIDGPSGAGKGTICRLVAEATGYNLLDSGALYRLTALATVRAEIDLNQSERVAEIARNLDIAFNVCGNTTQILLQGQEVSADIRAEAIGMAASKVAAYPAVRAALFERQKAFAQAPGLVADGRDMGTVIFPAAPVKIFLTASAQERANRRVLQLEGSGLTADYDKILKDIQQRDEQDKNRASAPLIPAEDAIILDSTVLSIEQVFETVMAQLRESQLRVSSTGK